MPALCPVSLHLLIHCSASTSFPLIVTNAVTHRRSRPCARLPCARFPCICSFTAPHPLHIHECCHSTSHTVWPSIFARKGIQREDAAVCYPSQPALWLSLHCCSAHSRRASHHVSPTLRSKPFLQPILMTVRHIVRQSCHPNFHTHTHTHGSRGYRKEGVHSVPDPCACVLERLQCVRAIVRVVVRVCMRAGCAWIRLHIRNAPHTVVRLSRDYRQQDVLSDTARAVGCVACATEPAVPVAPMFTLLTQTLET